MTATKRRKNTAKPPDEAALRAAGLRYLARYAASGARLQRILKARIDKAAREDAAFAADTERLAALRRSVAAIVVDFVEKKYLDDQAFASMKARRLRAAGSSRRGAIAKMQAAGLTAIAAAAALKTADGDGEQAEYAAALRLARRKKLGCFRTAPADAAGQRRDLAVLARAGFSHDAARRALTGTEDISRY